MVLVISVAATGTTALTVMFAPHLEEAERTGAPLPAWLRRDEGMGTVQDVAGGVVRLAEVAALPGGGGDEDQPPALALLAHPGGRRPGAAERAAQVDVDDGVEVVVGHLPQHPVAQHAGVGHQHVQPAELRHRRGHQALGHLRAADRSGRGHRPAACLPDRRGRLAGGSRVHVVDHHGRTGCGQRLGVREAEPPAGARDHSHFP
jgi:hypothetical protein